MDVGSLSRSSAPRPPSRTNDAQASAILKTAPALHLVRKTLEDLEMKTKETTLKPWRTGSQRGPVASFSAEGAQEKNGAGGRRKPLIRPDSAKETQGLSLLYLAGLWLTRPGFGWNWIWLGAGTPDSPTPRRRALVWPLAPCYATARRL
jgi:hypothetical protein